jgi:hypothetical protein
MHSIPSRVACTSFFVQDVAYVDQKRGQNIDNSGQGCFVADTSQQETQERSIAPSVETEERKLFAVDQESFEECERALVCEIAGGLALAEVLDTKGELFGVVFEEVIFVWGLSVKSAILLFVWLVGTLTYVVEQEK